MTSRFDLDIPQPKQSRSLQTQQSLIDAGWAILRDTPWEAVSVAMIARQAGRSVGIFYQRFGSKDEFLTVLIKLWLAAGHARLEVARPASTPLAVIDHNLESLYERIRSHRYFWRAALQRAMDDPQSWEPFRQLLAAIRQKFAEELGASRARPLDSSERHRLDLAVQVFNSVLNNALLNDPGPLRIDQAAFLPTLKRIFLTVAALDLA
ncbi:TetR/AcrR family transcriptional regulator [Sphingobium nicotianae]|uniref:TetR/AcrR family transcriptional regulator n=1 Tax=Sphingobium nicotianae TaxID=2782607 RepID=A0A9X1D9I0_9SPHN|nr:TetR/AcrR family transcriptional regulator [Sphingobium nicotianae]MBT2185781.1 TetR/AcrR family transcriptional regulator [Sphingobium nicotianae]